MDLMVILFVVSFLFLALGAVYKWMEDVYLTEPLIAMVVGIILGPQVLELINTDVPDKLKILEKTSEFTIAMALMAAALRLPKGFFRKNIKTQSVLVIFGMLIMWVLSSSIIYLVLHLPVAESLLIGAVLTPTDPVLSSTIISGEKAQKYLPSRIRNTLSFESGINDGLAYPIVIFSLFLLIGSEFPLNQWLTQTLLYETILCGIIAYGIGHLAGVIMHKAHKMNIMTSKAVLPFSMGLAFLLLSGLELLHMNGILAVFIGGLAYARAISDNEDIQEEKVQEAMERITLIPVFFIFGLLIPWEEWQGLGWDAVWIVLLILFFRRIPALLVLKPFLPQFKRRFFDSMLIGWFGPIGVAALYYAIMAEEKTLVEEVWIITSLVVFSSTIIHGVTSLPAGKLYHNKSSLPLQE